MAALRGEQPPAITVCASPSALPDWLSFPWCSLIGGGDPSRVLSSLLLAAVSRLCCRTCWGAAATSGPRWRRAVEAAPSQAAPRRGPCSATAASCPRRTATRSKPPPPGRWPGTGVFSLSCCPQNSYPGPPCVEMGGVCSCHPSRGGSFVILAIIKWKLNVKRWKIIVIKMLQYHAFSSS